MPTYQYACTDCAERLEVVQSFTDEPLSVCSSCGGRLRKVFSPVGIVFKGSGFYRTDSRKGADTGRAAANGSSGAKSDSDSGGSGSDARRSSGDKKAGSALARPRRAPVGRIVVRVWLVGLWQVRRLGSSGSGSSGSSSGSSGSSSGSKVA